MSEYESNRASWYSWPACEDVRCMTVKFSINMRRKSWDILWTTCASRRISKRTKILFVRLLATLWSSPPSKCRLLIVPLLLLMTTYVDVRLPNLEKESQPSYREVIKLQWAATKHYGATSQKTSHKWKAFSDIPIKKMPRTKWLSGHRWLGSFLIFSETSKTIE